jgi:hypothetical protein
MSDSEDSFTGGRRKDDIRRGVFRFMNSFVSLFYCTRVSVLLTRHLSSFAPAFTVGMTDKKCSQRPTE